MVAGATTATTPWNGNGSRARCLNFGYMQPLTSWSVAQDSTTCQEAAKFEPTYERAVPKDLPKHVNNLIQRGIAGSGTPCWTVYMAYIVYIDGAMDSHRLP